jgi:hypothetical protein
MAIKKFAAQQNQTVTTQLTATTAHSRAPDLPGQHGCDRSAAAPSAALIVTRTSAFPESVRLFGALAGTRVVVVSSVRRWPESVPTDEQASASRVEVSGVRV